MKKFYISDTAYGTLRIYVECDEENCEWHPFFKMLNSFSCWGGHDKQEKYWISWELPGDMRIIDYISVVLNANGYIKVTDWREFPFNQ